MTAGGEVGAAQQLQGHGAGDAAAGEGRHPHPQVAVTHLQRRAVRGISGLPVERAVAFQVGVAQHAAGPLHRIHQAVGNAAPVEAVRTLGTDRLQGVGQLGLADLGRLGPHRLAAAEAGTGDLNTGRQLAGGQEHAPQLRIASQLADLRRKRHQVVELGREPAACQLHGRRDHLVQRQSSQGAVRGGEPRYRTGHGDGTRPLQVGVVFHPRPAERTHRGRAGEAVQVRGHVQRRAHREPEHPAALPNLVHQVAAAADAARRRLDHPHGEGRRHRGVDHVAAAAQHLQGGGTGQAVLGRHHAALAERLLLAAGKYAMAHGVTPRRRRRVPAPIRTGRWQAAPACRLPARGCRVGPGRPPTPPTRCRG